MALDGHVNFAASTVTAAPAPPSSGTSLTVANGAVFPTAPFNCSVYPEGAIPTSSNAEIVRVTAKSGNVFTILRAQEFSTARAIQADDVIAATITAKWMDDLTNVVNIPNAAALNAANIFTQPQEIQASGAPPCAYRLRNTAGNSVPNARVYQLSLDNAGTLYFVPLADDYSAQGGYSTLSRTGDLSLPGNLLEKNRTTPMGHWTLVPYNAGNYSANGAMTWTVPSGAVLAHSYYLVGKTLTLAFYLNGTTIGGTPNTGLRIALPTGIAASYAVTTYWFIEAGTYQTGFLQVAAGSTFVELYHLNYGTNWAAGNVTVGGQVSVQLQ